MQFCKYRSTERASTNIWVSTVARQTLTKTQTITYIPLQKPLWIKASFGALSLKERKTISMREVILGRAKEVAPPWKYLSSRSAWTFLLPELHEKLTGSTLQLETRAIYSQYKVAILSYKNILSILNMYILNIAIDFAMLPLSNFSLKVFCLILLKIRFIFNYV